MIRLRNAVLAVSTVLFVAGCSTDDDRTTGQAPGEAGSASGQTSPSTTESPPPPPLVPLPPLVSGPSGDGAGPTPAPGTASEQPARPPASLPQRVSESGPATVPRAPGPTTPARPAPSASVGPQQSSIRLSAGVALPQTLPTGTAMSFSVDYQFTQGAPNPSWRYVWVVEPSNGPPAKIGVRLQERGTLQAFVLQLRPEHGPFESHIEDGQGSQLSRSIQLQ